MKATIIGVIIILIAAAGVIFFFLNRQPETPLPESTTINKQTTDKQEVENVLTIDSNLTVGSDSAGSNDLAGNYITGMAADAYKYSNADKIVLFFYADWCPTCRPTDTEFKEDIKKIPLGVEIYRVNYNDNDTDEQEKDLAKKYNVTYQHTFVQVDKNGNEITKWNGGGINKLVSSIK